MITPREASDAAQSAAGAASEHVTLQLLCQLATIFLVTAIVVRLSKRFLGQTDVAGEILAGLILGPSVLGRLFPHWMGTLFDRATSGVFVGISQIGLVFLMFQIGLEFEFKKKLASSKHAVFVISLVGIAFPFVLGYFAAPWLWDRIPGPQPSRLGFQLFFATAMSITAIPVLGRIFLELGLTHTRTAALTIGAAAIDDVVGWLLLGVVISVIGSNFAFVPLLARLAGLAAYVAGARFVLRPLIQRFVRAGERTTGSPFPRAIGPILIIVFVSAAITSSLGIFAVIGGFVVGLMLHEDRGFVREWRSRAGPLVNAFFLPLFFAYTGLRTDVGTLGDPGAWGQCLFICGIAFAGKFGGAYVACRALGESVRTSLTIGVCMNTRGLMELVALNIGYDLGILPKRVFTMFVLMSLASTFLATPVIRRLMKTERRETDEIMPQLAGVPPALDMETS